MESVTRFAHFRYFLLLFWTFLRGFLFRLRFLEIFTMHNFDFVRSFCRIFNFFIFLIFYFFKNFVRLIVTSASYAFLRKCRMLHDSLIFAILYSHFERYFVEFLRLFLGFGGDVWYAYCLACRIIFVKIFFSLKIRFFTIEFGQLSPFMLIYL